MNFSLNINTQKHRTSWRENLSRMYQEAYAFYLRCDHYMLNFTAENDRDTPTFQTEMCRHLDCRKAE